jgi:hypothetical protein
VEGEAGSLALRARLEALLDPPSRLDPDVCGVVGGAAEEALSAAGTAPPASLAELRREFLFAICVGSKLATSGKGARASLQSQVFQMEVNGENTRFFKRCS